MRSKLFAWIAPIVMISGCAPPNYEPDQKQNFQNPDFDLIIRFYSAYNSKNIKEMLECIDDHGSWLADDAGIPKELLRENYLHQFNKYSNLAVRIGVPYYQPPKTRNDGVRVRLEVSKKYINNWSTSL